MQNMSEEQKNLFSLFGKYWERAETLSNLSFNDRLNLMFEWTKTGAFNKSDFEHFIKCFGKFEIELF